MWLWTVNDYFEKVLQLTLQIIALREFQLKMAAWQKWFVQILTHIHNKKESVRKRTFLIKILVYSNGRSSCMNSNPVGKKNIYSDFVFCETTLRQMRPFRQFRCNDNGTNALRIDIHISTLLSRWYLIKLSTTFSKSMIILRNNNNRKKRIEIIFTTYYLFAQRSIDWSYINGLTK